MLRERMKRVFGTLDQKRCFLEIADMMDYKIFWNRQAIQMDQVLKMNSELLKQVKELCVQQDELIREIRELKKQEKSCNCGKQEEKKK